MQKLSRCLVLTFLLVVVSLHTAHAATTVTSGDFEYTVTDGKATVTRYAGSATEVTIPEALGGYPVVAIGKAAFVSRPQLVSVGFPEGLLQIGAEAFRSCSSLENIVLPDGMIRLGDYAFSGCTSLTDFIIPDSVTSLGAGICSYCENMVSVSIGDGLDAIPYDSFSFCKSLAKVTYGKGITSIGVGAFSCTALTEATIPSSVTHLGESSFSGCKALKKAVVPDGIRSLSSGIFSGCSSLESVVLPKGLLSIDACVFRGCEKLSSITLPASLEWIGSGAFEKAGLKSITIPPKITALNGDTFQECRQLQRLTIPDTVKSMGNSVFAGCDGLTSVVISKGVQRIEYGVFAGCTKLTTVTMSDNVTYIGTSAFTHCDSLTGIALSEGLTTIDSEAFAYCASLQSVVIPEGVRDIGDAAFYACSSLVGAHFQTTAPSSDHFGFQVFDEAAKNFSIYFLSNKSHWTQPVWQEYPSKQEPAPANLRATSESYRSIALQWSFSGSAVGYEIWRLKPGDDMYGLAGTSTTTRFTDVGLNMGTSYQYVIRPYGFAGPAAYYMSLSSFASGKPALSKPKVTVASTGYNRVKVRWGKVEGAKGYRLYRATSKSGTYKLIEETTSLSYTDKSLTTGKTYYYKVKAYRTVSGTKKYGSYSTVVSGKPVPAAPTSVKVSRVSDSSVKITWYKVSGATKYQVYRATSKGGTYSRVAETNSLSYTNKSLKDGTTYYYKVRAYHTESGKKVYGSYGAVVSATP